MVLGIVMISPVLSYLGIRGIFSVVALLAVLFVVFRAGDLPVRRWFLGIAAAIFLLSFVPALYWTEMRYVFSPHFS